MSKVITRVGALFVFVLFFIGLHFVPTRAATNLVAGYSFDEGSGTAVTDVSGNGNTGTITNAVWTPNGRNGGALSFDGNGDWVTVADSVSLDLTNRMTLEAWVRPAALQDWTTIILKERGDGLSYSLYASDNTNNPPAVYGRISNADRFAAGQTTLPLNTWSHVAGTYDGANFRLYVNGNLVRTVARSGNITTSNNPLRIGGNSVWGEYFNGLIDDVRIHKAVLTQAEIQQEMGTPVAPPPPDTAAPSAPTGLTATATSTTQINLSWTASTDNVGVASYRIIRGGTQVGTATGTSFNNTGLTAGTSYTYLVQAVDAAGNVSADSNTVTATTLTPDTISPTVSITSPTSGAIVNGTVTIAADASDNVGVAGVRFFVNGTAVGGEDTTAPYTASWNTSSLTAGTYNLTAQARDAANNTTTSATVTTQVTGDFSFNIQQPTVTLPSEGDGFYEIDIAYLNGFTTPGIDLWVSGLPAGVNGRYLFDPLVHQGTTEFLITTEGIPAGTYTFTLGGTDNGGTGLSHSQQVTLIVDNTPDFSIEATPQNQNVIAGGSVDFSLNLTPYIGFNNNVSFAATGLPLGATAVFTPTSLTPPGTAIVRISTNVLTPAGEHTITVNATGGGITRSTQVAVTVASSAATWNVSVLGSTGTANNSVRVGKVRTDGLNRVYVGTIGTGRVLEYSRNGAAWSGPVDAGGSPSGQEIHDMTIGNGRGDGQDRIYAASYDRNVYEIWHDGVSWRQITVATLDNQGMHAAVGDGRGDGVNRLYVISTMSLYEYTWNGVAWVGGKIGDTFGAHGLVVGAPRGIGQMGVYIASISYGSFEARWNGTAWNVASMGDDGDVRNIYVGNGRNDGVNRVYGALFDGRLREFSWNGSSWTITHGPAAPGGLIHSYVLPGRGDGVNRVYSSSTNGKIYEHSWNGTAWSAPVNTGGSSDYMYGQHFGDGRNDGIIRIYSADRGSVNQVYEFTWSGAVADTQPPTAPTNLTGNAGVGTVALNWLAATDNLGVTQYNIHRSVTPGFTPGAANKVGQTTSTTLNFNQNGLAAGTYYYVVTAQDGIGNVGPASNEAAMAVISDTQAPTVTLTSPADGANVSGVVSLGATASDDFGVVGVTFLVDGVAVGGEDATAPYSFGWNSASVTNGSHTISARARDNGGNTTTTSTITVNVNNSVVANLIASYNFNAGSGSTAADGAGGDNDGAITNALWNTGGRYGGALSFDGNGDFVAVNDANNLDLTTGMTLEAWVRPTSLTNWTTVVMKETVNTMAYALYASDYTNQPPAGYIQINGDRLARGGSALPLNTWSYLATTYDGSVLRIYVNGTQVGSLNLSGSIAVSSGQLKIGGNAIWGEYFNGLIDEVRIYNRALSATEIQTDMDTPLP